MNYKKCWWEYEEISIASGNVKWYSYYGNSLAVPQKVKHRITIWPSSSTPLHISERIETYVHTKMCTQTFIVALFIIEATQVSISWGMNKQNIVYACNGILFSHIKEWITVMCYSID
jgi:hypothetical protein